MANSDTMGLGAAGGASVVASTLEDLVKQSILRHQMQLAIAREAEERRQFESQLGQRQAEQGEQSRQFGATLGQRKAEQGLEAERHGLNVRQWEESAPDRAATTKGVELTNQRTQRLLSTRAALAADPRFGTAVTLADAGVPLEGINVEQTPEQSQAFALERIRAQGDQNVRSAAAAAQRAMSGVMPIATVDDEGNPITMVVPRSEAVNQTYRARPPAEQQNRTMAARRASTVIEGIDELSKRINQQQGVIAKISGSVERAKAQANLSDDVSEYQALISGFTPLLARAVGHTGVLTEQDVLSVRQMLPNPGDSEAVRTRKLNRVRSIWTSMNAMQQHIADTPDAPNEPSSGGLPPGVTVRKK